MPSTSTSKLSHRPHTATIPPHPGLRGRLERHRFAGFTLLELIVVIVVLGLLAALAVPAFRAVNGRVQDTTTARSLEALGRSVAALAAIDNTTPSVSTLTTVLAEQSTAAAEPVVSAGSFALYTDPVALDAPRGSVHAAHTAGYLGVAASVPHRSGTRVAYALIGQSTAVAVVVPVGDVTDVLTGAPTVADGADALCVFGVADDCPTASGAVAGVSLPDPAIGNPATGGGGGPAGPGDGDGDGDGEGDPSGDPSEPEGPGGWTPPQPGDFPQGTVMSDQFERPNGSDLGVTTVGGFAWQTSGSPIEIASNALRLGGSGAGTRYAVVDAGVTAGTLQTFWTSTSGTDARYVIASSGPTSGMYVNNSCAVFRFSGTTDTQLRAPAGSCPSGTQVTLAGRTISAVSGSTQVFSFELPEDVELGTYWGVGQRNTGGSYSTTYQSVSLSGLDVGFPQAPSDLLGTTGASGPQLTWTPATQPHVLSYRVFRDGEAYVDVPASDTTFTDTSAVEGSTHVYALRSVTVFGNVSVSTTTVGLLATVPDGLVFWDSFARGAGANLGVTPVGGLEWETWGTMTSLTGTRLQLGGSTAGTRYAAVDTGVSEGTLRAVYTATSSSNTRYVIAGTSPNVGIYVDTSCAVFTYNGATSTQIRAAGGSCPSGVSLTLQGRTLTGVNGTAQAFTFEVPEHVELGTYWGVGQQHGSGTRSSSFSLVQLSEAP